MLTAGLLAAVAVLGAHRRAAVRRRLRPRRSRPSIRSASPVERYVRDRLDRADVDIRADLVARLGSVGLAAVAVLGWSVTPALALLAPVLALLGGLGALRLADGRREARLLGELPALLEVVARSMRTGAPLPLALREAASGSSAAAADLATVVAEVDAGVPWGDALRRWTEGRPHPDLRLAAGALVVALSAGGSPARAVDGVAATLRERAEVDRELRALATQARTSAAVVAGAPLAFGALGLLGDERTTAFLLGTPAGLACLLTGLGLDLAGAAWMRRIARGPAPA